jgi:two-component system response regulator HupR/HoxA
MELHWEELNALHVVRKFAQIINRRWSLGLGFASADGQRLEIPRQGPHAQVSATCQLVQSCADGEGRCGETALAVNKLLSVHAISGDVPASSLAYTCHAGLKEVAVPIVLDTEYLGCVIAGGFLTAGEEERERPEVERRTATLPILAADRDPAIARQPRLTHGEVSYLTELMELVAEEIVAFQGEVERRSRTRLLATRDVLTRYSYDQIIGRSQPMQDLYRLLDKVVDSESTVLIQGENGTGKELVARAIHYNSSRRTERFVAQNCSALNDNLLDSELFGHKKGAFTGAVVDKQGLFELADRGTFFLDELGDMSPALQVKLLRVLQEGVFTAVGDTEPRKVDVRIIAATNRDLRGMVDRAEFREDLFYRINVINLVIPPLRDRLEDLPMLVDHFLKRTVRDRPGIKPAVKRPAAPKRLAKGCMDRMYAYAWPGNIRELENEIERLVVLAGDERMIVEELLSERIRLAGNKRGRAGGRSLAEAVDGFEKTLVQEALLRHQWNRTQAAADLRTSRRNLLRKIEKYKLSPRTGPRGGG